VAYGDLAMLGDVKAWLQTGINPFPAADDALLTRLISAASQFIQGWLNRRIAPCDWQEVRDGTGGQRLQFANPPVTAVLSVTIDGHTISPASPGGGLAGGYLFTSTELVLHGHVFSRGAQNVILLYTAGYVVTPPEITQACIELVAQRYRERSRIGAVSKSLGGETVRFSQLDMSADIRTVLAQYRMVAPMSGFSLVPAATATDPALLAAI